jgi:hypothetical protein
MSQLAPVAQSRIFLILLGFLNDLEVQFIGRMKPEVLRNLAYLSLFNFLGEDFEHCEFEAKDGWMLCPEIDRIILRMVKDGYATLSVHGGIEITPAGRDLLAQSSLKSDNTYIRGIKFARKIVQGYESARGTRLLALGAHIHETCSGSVRRALIETYPDYSKAQWNRVYATLSEHL